MKLMDFTLILQSISSSPTGYYFNRSQWLEKNTLVCDYEYLFSFKI